MAFSLVRIDRGTQSGPRIHQSRDPHQGNSGRESDPGYTRSKHNILKKQGKTGNKDGGGGSRLSTAKSKQTPSKVPVRNFWPEDIKF